MKYMIIAIVLNTLVFANNLKNYKIFTILQTKPTVASFLPASVSRVSRQGAYRPIAKSTLKSISSFGRRKTVLRQTSEGSNLSDTHRKYIESFKLHSESVL